LPLSQKEREAQLKRKENQTIREEKTNYLLLCLAEQDLSRLARENTTATLPYGALGLSATYSKQKRGGKRQAMFLDLEKKSRSYI
jgi:hypothetical protein